MMGSGQYEKEWILTTPKNFNYCRPEGEITRLFDTECKSTSASSFKWTTRRCIMFN